LGDVVRESIRIGAQEKVGKGWAKTPTNAQKWHKIRNYFLSPVLRQDTAKALKDF